MDLVGRVRELESLDRLLDDTAAGSGGVLVVTGPPGSGRTAFAAETAARADRHGLAVFRAAAVGPRPSLWAWAQLLRDVGAHGLAAQLPATPDPLTVDAAAIALCSGPLRLLLVDDVAADPGTVAILACLAARAAGGPTAVVVTSTAHLGIGREVRLSPLGPEDIGLLTGELRPDVRLALGAAARGLPGPALQLAARVRGLPARVDPIVELALLADSGEGFLVLDPRLVDLLETALQRPTTDGKRARLLARLAQALTGDAAAADRRRALADEAAALAREDSDPATLAEVLDARLNALWDPGGADDRLHTSAEIIELARASGDLARERNGIFWRFVALMELGRVDQAEAALAWFASEAAAAGDETGTVMAVSRHAMLATLRGRFAEARELIAEVDARGRQLGLVDTERLVGTLHGAIAVLRSEAPAAGHDPAGEIREYARRQPGHFYDATAARVLLLSGRVDEAGLELDRALPRLLAGAGPRWLGAAASLADVAVAVARAPALGLLSGALRPYRGRLVVWGGANSTAGPVSHYLGALAAAQGQLDQAVDDFEDAERLERETGALPILAHTLVALADALTARRAAGDLARADACRNEAHRIAEQLDLPGVLASVGAPPDTWVLLREGPDWLLTAGTEGCRLRDSRGLHYLRALLAAPGIEIPALDLVAGGAGLAGASADPILDDAARESFRRRVAELDAELDRADVVGDEDRARRAASERLAILDELRRATGLGGRARRMAADEERARVNVTRTLRAAVERIAAAAPHAGAHLEASLRTGRVCRYQPAPGGPSGWRL